MFLIQCMQSAVCQFGRCAALMAICVGTAVTLKAMPATEPSLPCVLEVPVYDPFGTRLAFAVVGVTLADNRKIDLLAAKVDGMATVVRGEKVLFSSRRIVGGAAIEVTLQGPRGARISDRMVITDCRLRRSLVYGQADRGLDVWRTLVTGRLVGCRLEGDWWVSALPMFGGHQGVQKVDGHIEVDGTFRLGLGTWGVRHVVLVGKDKHPVRAFGIDVVVGKDVDIGVIDLRGSCPK